MEKPNRFVASLIIATLFWMPTMFAFDEGKIPHELGFLLSLGVVAAIAVVLIIAPMFLPNRAKSPPPDEE